MKIMKLILTRKKIFLFLLKNLLYLQKKFIEAATKFFDKITSFFFFPISILVFIFIIFIYPRALIRIGRFRSDKIGHLSLEYEIYLAEKKKIQKKKIIDFWFKDKIICNQYLFNIRKKQLNLIPSLIFKEVYFLFKIFNLNNFICDRKFTDSDLNYKLDKTPISFKLDTSIIQDNLKKLYQIGLNKNKKIVLIHLRDSAYRGYSKMTDYKNINDISPYYKTIYYLINKGFFVIRTGRAANIKFEINSKNFLDYPFSNLKSDEMDLVIANQSFLTISSGSGFDGIVRTFRKPVLFTNFVPLGFFHSFGRKNMTIFKHCINKNTGKKLSAKKLLDLNLIYNHCSENFEKNNILLKQNSSSEILEATKEMLNYINNNFKIINRQPKNIKNFFVKEIKKKYLFSMHKKINSLIPISFLKKNKNMFL